MCGETTFDPPYPIMRDDVVKVLKPLSKHLVPHIWTCLGPACSFSLLALGMVYNNYYYMLIIINDYNGSTFMH